MAASPDHNVLRPFREALALELKPWLDPVRPEHCADLVRTLIALRNHGGGSLIIGIKNDGTPRRDRPVFDLRAAYHPDQIHDLVSRYASDRFEVSSEILMIADEEYVRIDVPAGIRTPVRVRAAIAAEGKAIDHLKAGEVPVRTLESNGRPSTAACGPADWERLMETCFENREADIARFIRRHLAGAAPAMSEILAALRSLPDDDRTAAATAFLNLGLGHFEAEVSRRNLDDNLLAMLNWGAREVALVILPAPIGQSADRAFLNRMIASVPRLTSYPPWLDTGIGGADAMPNVRDRRWEGLLAHRDRFDALTFEILDPKGQFYERRLMLPDVIARASSGTPTRTLGEREAIADVAEALLTGLEFAKTLGVADEVHELNFAFRWSGLDGRIVDDWFLGGPSHYVAVEGISTICTLSIPADRPGASLGADIVHLMKPLFELFRGYQSPPQQAEETLQAMLQRRSPY